MSTEAEYDAIQKELAAISKAEAEEAKYYALQKELKRVEEKYEDKFDIYFYLTDELVDRQNVLVDGRQETDPDFWPRMIWAAQDAAGLRAEEYGIDINKELGRRIY